jgi:hypothetical protein
LCVTQRTENMDRKHVTEKDDDRTGMKTSSPVPIAIMGFRTKLETLEGSSCNSTCSLPWL